MTNCHRPLTSDDNFKKILGSCTNESWLHQGRMDLVCEDELEVHRNPPSSWSLQHFIRCELKLSHQLIFRSQDGEHWLSVCLQQLSNQVLHFLSFLSFLNLLLFLFKIVYLQCQFLLNSIQTQSYIWVYSFYHTMDFRIKIEIGSDGKAVKQTNLFLKIYVIEVELIFKMLS